MRHIAWEHLASNYLDEGYNYTESDYSEESDFEDKVLSYNPDMYQDLDFTPMGVFHSRDVMNPMKHFDFYIGRTTFRISAEDKRLIQAADGVEVFFQWTPYSFIVAPARMFQWTDVRESIEKNLFGDSDSDIIVDSFTINDNADDGVVLKEFQDELDKGYNYWITHTTKDEHGVFCTYIGCNRDDNTDFKTLLDMYRYMTDVNISDSIENSDFYKKDKE